METLADVLRGDDEHIEYITALEFNKKRAEWWWKEVFEKRIEAILRDEEQGGTKGGRHDK